MVNTKDMHGQGNMESIWWNRTRFRSHIKRKTSQEIDCRYIDTLVMCIISLTYTSSDTEGKIDRNSTGNRFCVSGWTEQTDEFLETIIGNATGTCWMENMSTAKDLYHASSSNLSSAWANRWHVTGRRNTSYAPASQTDYSAVGET